MCQCSLCWRCILKYNVCIQAAIKRYIIQESGHTNQIESHIQTFLQSMFLLQTFTHQLEHGEIRTNRKPIVDTLGRIRWYIGLKSQVVSVISLACWWLLWWPKANSNDKVVWLQVQIWGFQQSNMKTDSWPVIHYCYSNSPMWYKHTRVVSDLQEALLSTAGSQAQ